MSEGNQPWGDDFYAEVDVLCGAALAIILIGVAGVFAVIAI